MPPRVLVVGAGALGASAALALAEGGAEVTVVERGPGPGLSGASARGAGIASVLAWHPIDVRLVRRTLQRFRALSAVAEARGHAFRLHVTGSATLAGPADVPRLEELAVLVKREGAEVRLLDADEARPIPGLGGLDFAGVAAVAFAPGDAWANPPAYADLCLSLARERGATFRSNADVRGLALDGSRVTGVRLGDGSLVEADVTLVAGGAWTAGLLASAGAPLPLAPYRTQAVVVDGVPAATAIVHDTVQGCYFRPDAPGRALVGDGTTTMPEHPDLYRHEADDAFVAVSIERLARRVPAAASATVVSARAGLDTATPDRHPLVGPDPRFDALHLLVGGNGFGFMRSAALGESAAAGILGRRAAVPTGAYATTRFEGLWKEPFSIREGFSL